MKCIFAQGNPGLTYRLSRHNIGFRCLDEYAASRAATFVTKTKFFATLAELTIHDEKVLLVQPTTFYNQTGRSLQAISDFYKLPTEAILVLHDDLALDFGTLRIRHRGSDGGNNGIKSLNATLGEHYARLRIGIATPQRHRLPDADYVLSRFTPAEEAILQTDIIPASQRVIDQFLQGDLVDESFRV